MICSYKAQRCTRQPNVGIRSDETNPSEFARPIRQEDRQDAVSIERARRWRSRDRVARMNRCWTLRCTCIERWLSGTHDHGLANRGRNDKLRKRKTRSLRRVSHIEFELADDSGAVPVDPLSDVGCLERRSRRRIFFG